MMPEEEEESLSEMRRISQILLQEDEVEEEEEDEAPTTEEAAAEEEGLKVKIVLTRGELEWLMAQIKTGDHRLHDVLHHMHALKAAAAATSAAVADKQGGWRPRLESILECPETAAAT
uniref:Uncharacterized protein n=1 Tax=Arundo donax TaxID=35708 RepID=A0A0A9H7L8_ARUDO